MNPPLIVLFLAAFVHVSGYVLLARRIEPFMYNFYVVAWWSYIAMVDAALALKKISTREALVLHCIGAAQRVEIYLASTASRVPAATKWLEGGGRLPRLCRGGGDASPLNSHFLIFNRELPFLLIISAAFWCIFELINLRIQNWYYVNIPSMGLIRFVGYLLAYGTVIPGIYVTKKAFSALLGSIRVRPLSCRFNPAPVWLWASLCFSSSCFSPPNSSFSRGSS